MDRRVFDPIINPLPLADGVAIQVNWPRVAFALVPAALMLLALGFKAGQGISNAPPAATEVPSAAAIEGEPTLELVAEPASKGMDSRSPMVPLGIFVRGPSELASAAAIEIIGLPSGWALSAGRPLGDRWRIPAAQLSAAAIIPPPGSSGAVDLQVELRLADDTLVEVRSVRRAMTDPALATENTPNTNLLLSRAQSLLVLQDISAARLLLQKAAEAGNTDAALLLGETYERCSHYVASLRCAKDHAAARIWYEMAAKLGSAEARERLDRLAGSVHSPPLSRRSFANDFNLSIERDLIVH